MTDASPVRTVDDWPMLAEALTDHPLVGVDDLDLNMSELAATFSVSTNTVKNWLNQPDDPMPYVEAGGNGREYVLRLSWCFAWRQRQDAKKTMRTQKLAELQGQFGGLDKTEIEQGLTAKQVRELAEARMAHAAAAKMLGTQTEIDGVYRLLEEVFVIVRNSAMGACDRLERELTLTPAQTRATERVMEEMLISMMDTIQASAIGKDYTPNLDLTRQLVNET